MIGISTFQPIKIKHYMRFLYIKGTTKTLMSTWPKVNHFSQMKMVPVIVDWNVPQQVHSLAENNLTFVGRRFVFQTFHTRTGQNYIDILYQYRDMRHIIWDIVLWCDICFSVHICLYHLSLMSDCHHLKLHPQQSSNSARIPDRST